MKLGRISYVLLLLFMCEGSPLSGKNLPHSRDYYAGYIKAITDNFDQLFPGERKARSTHDDEKERLFEELLSKNSERGKVETLADIKHFQGGDTRSLMEMKRDVGSQEGYPDIDTGVVYKPHTHFRHHHLHRHRVPHVPHIVRENDRSLENTHNMHHLDLLTRNIHNSNTFTRNIKNSSVLTRNIHNSNTVTGNIHSAKLLTGNMRDPTRSRSSPAQRSFGDEVKNKTTIPTQRFSNRKLEHRENTGKEESSSNIRPSVNKLVKTSNNTALGKVNEKLSSSNESTMKAFENTTNVKKHRKTAAHKKYILSRFLEPEETVPDARRTYILEHGDHSSLPLYQGSILNYQDSSTPRLIGGEFDPNDNGGLRSPYDRGYPPYPSSFGGDMFGGQFGGQFFGPQNEHPLGGNFMDSFGENMNMNNGMRFAGISPESPFSEFNNGVQPSRGRFGASMPTMSSMEKAVYATVQGSNGVFTPSSQPSIQTGNSIFGPDNEGPQYPQFGSSQAFTSTPNSVSYNPGDGGDDEVVVNPEQGPVGLPTERNSPVGLPTDQTERNGYEDVREEERGEDETQVGETRSKIKKMKKDARKKKHKTERRCGVFNGKMTENRILTPACNPDGSCTLVPSKITGCLNTAAPLNPDFKRLPVGFPQVPLMPVLVPAPFGQPFPVAPFGQPYPQLSRIGNAACRNCIFPPVRGLKFLIVPLINGRIFNGPPCNADLLSPYLG